MNFSFNSKNGPKNKSNIIVGAIVLVLGIVFLFFIARGIFTLLSFIAPFLLILALIIDYRVVVKYLKSIWTYLSKSPIVGILMILFTIFGFPIVAAYLMVKAIISKRVDLLDKEVKMRNEQFDEYEDVSNEAEFLELKELDESSKKAEEKNDYENLF